MALYSGFESCKHQLYSKYEKEPWFVEVLGYFTIRYPPIEARIVDTFRYVEFAPKNASTFSYEFGSVLRDIGSVVSSILDKLTRNTAKKPTGRYDITDYLKFLIRDVKAIELIGVELNCPFRQRMVFPFYRIADAKILWKDRLMWWTPYNNLKHSEINNLSDGCLTNVVYGTASLAILYKLIYPYRHISRFFSFIGYFKPMDTVYSYSFPTV